MRGLVSDLLLLARADTPRERAREEVDIAAIVRAAAGEAAPLAEGHDLTVDAPEGLFVEGWAADLHRLVLNLIENALQHTPPGTAVNVRTFTPDEGHVSIVIEDEGPGLPAAIRDRAFERFVRGAGDGGKGSGLGLAIVSAVAEGHDGAVVYEERPSGGARFTVTIPGAARAAPAPRPREGSSTV
jgi:two-component system OmpR family sensor kinase